jgi:hypothetical protein
MMIFDRPISHDQARQAARRLIGEMAKVSTPTQPDDDDILICDYIEQQRLKDGQGDEALASGAAIDAARETTAPSII